MYAARMWRSLVRSSLVVSVAAGGWLAGTLCERRRRSGTDTMVLPNLPALPIFGTVSAATAFEYQRPPTVGVEPSDGKMVPMESSLEAVRAKGGENRIAQIMRFGFPGLDNIKSYGNYVLSYDQRTRVAHWVFEHLTADTVRRSDGVDRSKCQFTEDKTIHPYFRAANADYRGSGFDRGHLAAAGNHRSDQADVERTFFLSNMAPQVGPGFNRDSWNRLEKHVRRLTNKYKNVYVCTGPLYLPRKEDDGKTYVRYQVIGTNSIAVPTHFFKVIVGERKDNTLDMEAYVMPNQPLSDDTPLSVFQVPPESIERAAGLLFFDRIMRDKLQVVNGRRTTYV